MNCLPCVKDFKKDWRHNFEPEHDITAFSCSNLSPGINRKNGDRAISKMIISEAPGCPTRLGLFPSFCYGVLRLVLLRIAKWPLLLQASHPDNNTGQSENLSQKPLVHFSSCFIG